MDGFLQIGAIPRKPHRRRERCPTDYIIFDVEWNRSADERSTVQDPVHLHGEIVEIGAVKAR